MRRGRLETNPAAKEGSDGRTYSLLRIFATQATAPKPPQNRPKTAGKPPKWRPSGAQLAPENRPKTAQAAPVTIVQGMLADVPSCAWMLTEDRRAARTGARVG